jgi:hypothetical protein
MYMLLVSTLLVARLFLQGGPQATVATVPTAGILQGPDGSGDYAMSSVVMPSGAMPSVAMLPIADVLRDSYRVDEQVAITIADVLRNPYEEQSGTTPAVFFILGH